MTRDRPGFLQRFPEEINGGSQRMSGLRPLA